jgi:predicted phosphodiesterase
MRYAILADIHANLSALQAVLLDAKAQNCGRIVSLGDLVGYGSYHSECVRLMQQQATAWVRGNFDDYVSTEIDLRDFNPHAAEAIQQMRQALSEDQKEWLQGLPYVAEFDGFTMVHASLENPQMWQYVFDKFAAASSMNQQATQICFFGHTHVPVAFVCDSIVRGGSYSRFKVESDKKYFINPGSVGQPRDNNPKASYAIYDSEEKTVELRRVDYKKPDGSDGNGFAGKLKPGPVSPLSGENTENF